MRSIIDPPPPSARARFAPGFGQRFLLSVEVTRMAPAAPHSHDPARLAAFQLLCEAEGVVPVYFLGPDTVRAEGIREAWREPLGESSAEIGVRLELPTEGPEGAADGMAIERLVETIEARFGTAPIIARAALLHTRHESAAMLSACGVVIDSSVRPLFDCSSGGGPDYRHHPAFPYWLDEDRTLLELPQTAIFWGMLRRQGTLIHPLLRSAPALGRQFARLGLLERIAFAPEAAGVEQAIRAIDIALDDGLPLLVFSCRLDAHGTDEAFDALCDWWRRIFAYLELRHVPNTSVAAILRAVER